MTFLSNKLSFLAMRLLRMVSALFAFPQFEVKQVPWHVWRNWSKNQRNRALSDGIELVPAGAQFSDRRRLNGWDKLSTFDKDGKPLD